MQRQFAVALALTLLVAGCSGSGDDDVRAEPPTTATSPPSVAPSPTAAPTTEAPSPTAAPSPSPTAAPSPDPADLRVALETVAEGYGPLTQVFAHDGRTLVLEQEGRVTAVDSGEVLLDLTDRVRSGGEQGLLGADVHPDGDHWVVHYTGSDGQTVLATFLVGDDGLPDRSSEEVVLSVSQPAANHNGGTAVFGPDGMFWLALGDGGGANDQFDNGQDRSTLLGALLRLDLDDPSVARIPADNPFVDDPDAAGEIWAYGLRNPYRVDVTDDQVYIADVGQNEVEEVTALTYDQAGANLGWPILEGNTCFQGDCDPSEYEPADVDYTHGSVGGGCSVIGGHVYDGEALPALRGHFLYGDLCAGILRSVRAEGGDTADEFDLTEQVGSVAGVTGIGVDADGEAVLVFGDGRIQRLVPG